MATETSKTVRHAVEREKRGGYGSSSKQVSKLTAPPRGPAPGASKSTRDSAATQR